MVPVVETFPLLRLEALASLCLPVSLWSCVSECLCLALEHKQDIDDDGYD